MKMKKRMCWAALALAAGLLAGCGAQPVQEDTEEEAQEETTPEPPAAEDENANLMAALVEANNAKKLWEEYGSFQIETHTTVGDETFYMNTYVEEGLNLTRYFEEDQEAQPGEALAYLYTPEGDVYVFMGEDGPEFALPLYAMADDSAYRIAPEVITMAEPDGTLQETVTATAPLSGGKLEIRTERDGEIRDYTVDGEKLVIFSSEEAIPQEDGATLLADSAVSYGVERPALLEELLQFAQDAQSGEDLRTVTVIVDPGQDGETVYSKQVRQGVSVITVPGENYTLCRQTEDGMVPLSGTDPADYTHDVTVYAIAQSEE